MDLSCFWGKNLWDRGAILAFLGMEVFPLSVYTVAGAALLGTFLTSIAGVFLYNIIPAMDPDWRLGILFGAGGMLASIAGPGPKNVCLKNSLNGRWA